MALNRRDFLKTTTASCMALAIPESVWQAFKSINEPVKIGLITDLHQDTMHDGKERLQTFLNEMKIAKPDGIIQMGDFAYPGEVNSEVISMFNNAHPKALHVIGNHDTDAGYTREQCVEYWGMKSRYYVEEIGGVHFIILDGNEKGSPVRTGGYASYIGEEQWLWLIQQLKTIQGPIVIVSHQPLAGILAVDNAEEIQNILDRYSDKILLAINGHSHVNCLVKVGKINYLHINSASYFWVGGKYIHNSYSEEVHNSHKWISYTCPYKESLFTTMTIDPVTKTINIEGRNTEWMGASPAELGADDVFPSLILGEEIAPKISPRTIEKINKE